MLGDDKIKEMQEELDALEEEVAKRKRELHEKRYSGLRTAMEARKAADGAIMEELKSLGIRAVRGNWVF